MEMEITNIKENAIWLSSQGSTPGRVKGAREPNEQAGRSDTAKELFKKVSKGDAEATKGLTEEANKVLEAMGHHIQFVVDQESKNVVIKVVDSEGNLIRQIPPEDLASFASATGTDLGFLLNKQL
jgi:uncharacterized FlaG/YvyC family protein